MEIDLHGYSLEEANKKIFEFIMNAMKKLNQLMLLQVKVKRSKNTEDPYSSFRFRNFKNSSSRIL